MLRCDPDKVRFCDPEALTSASRVHSVDLSDDRSSRPFLTLWVKGEADAWAEAVGLSRDHDRAVYHRDLPWLPATFPGMEFKRWDKHYHLDLPGPPVWSDVEQFASDIPRALLEEIRQYLAVKERPCL